MQQQQTKPQRNPWLIVRRWPGPSPNRRGLRPEAKLVWGYLFEGAGGIERSFFVHAANVGAACGMSERACRRALDSLADWTLIDIPDRLNGEIMIYLNDPQKVAAARLLPGESNGQGELEFADTPPSPSEGLPTAQAGTIPLPLGSRPLPDPPADLAPDPPPPNIEHDARARIKTLNINIPSKNIFSIQRTDFGGSDAKSADFDRVVREAVTARNRQADDEPKLLAAPDPNQAAAIVQTLAARVARIDIPGQDVKAHETAAWILRHLEPVDATYRKWATDRCLALAWVVVEGRWPSAELAKLLDQLRETERLGKLRGSRAQWFLGVAASILRKLGIQFWEGRK